MRITCIYIYIYIWDIMGPCFSQKQRHCRAWMAWRPMVGLNLKWLIRCNLGQKAEINSGVGGFWKILEESANPWANYLSQLSQLWLCRHVCCQRKTCWPCLKNRCTVHTSPEKHLVILVVLNGIAWQFTFQPATLVPTCFELMFTTPSDFAALFCLPCHVWLTRVPAAKRPVEPTWFPCRHGSGTSQGKKHLGIFRDIWNKQLSCSLQIAHLRTSL